MKYELEVIAFDIVSCKLAAVNGATRIELCANPNDGGTTPSYGMIELARKSTQLQLFPIIRPRGGDFLYSKEEVEIMISDVRICKKLGADGVVIGLLNKNGEIDLDNCKKLIDAADDMDITFHRAFDRVKDPFNSLEQIIKLGCKRILTSGLHPTVDEGINTLRSLVEKASQRIIIMPGSGVRSGNIIDIAKKTGAFAFHSSARNTVFSEMEFTNPDMNEKLSHASLDPTELKNMKDKLDSFFEQLS
jgi:copper homeostasis protein